MYFSAPSICCCHLLLIHWHSTTLLYSYVKLHSTNPTFILSKWKFRLKKAECYQISPIQLLIHEKIDIKCRVFDGINWNVCVGLHTFWEIMFIGLYWTDVWQVQVIWTFTEVDYRINVILQVLHMFMALLDMRLFVYRGLNEFADWIIRAAYYFYIFRSTVHNLQHNCI